MTAQVLALPLARRECSNCEWCCFTNQGLFCLTFCQPVWEKDAVDCDAFDPADGSRS